jgi:hypothetical protein
MTDAVSGGGPNAPRVRGLLDTAPLRATLASAFDLPGGGFPLVQERLQRRDLWAVAIVTSNYTTGQAVIWVGGRDLQGWERPARRSRQTAIALEHVMASAAIPLFFPAVLGAYGSASAMNCPATPSPPIEKTTYCLPSCMYVIGAPPVPASSSISQTTLPLALS